MTKAFKKLSSFRTKQIDFQPGSLTGFGLFFTYIDRELLFNKEISPSGNELVLTNRL